MTEPFIGEIQLFGFNFAPVDWATCTGQTIQIRQNSALFALIGTIYGGDGQQTFQLPNLVNRLPCGIGTATGGMEERTLGDAFGENDTTLTTSMIAPHTHRLNAYSDGTGTPVATPVATSALGLPTNVPLYGTDPINTAMALTAITPGGNNQPHENRQPMLAINYCIALTGNYPAFP